MIHVSVQCSGELDSSVCGGRALNAALEPQGVSVCMHDCEDDEDDLPEWDPPTTEQGGPNSRAPSKFEPVGGYWCGIDYLTQSYPRHPEPMQLCKEIEAMLRSAGQEVQWGHGYKGKDICGGYGQILMRQCRDSGDGDVLVRLPGRAMDWIREANALSESELQCTDADVCRFFLDRGFVATRLDAAIDTNDPEVTPAIVRELIKAQSFTCRARSAGINQSWKLEGDGSHGTAETVYLGSRDSLRFFRCYDKGFNIFKATGRDVGHLVRFELEIKNEAAQKAAELIANKGNACIPGVFAGWICFKDPTDKNDRVDRRRNAAWWDRIVGGFDPIALGLTHPVPLPEKTMKWLKHQVAKSLFLADKYGFLDEIVNAMESKRAKVKKDECARWDCYAKLKNNKKPYEDWEGESNAASQK